jgi:cyclin H
MSRTQGGTADVDCLTAAEELAIIAHYTSTCLRIADAFSFPTNVKATAAQYLKRFYLSNSVMTYHPKNLFPACLFLSTKTENNYISLERFTEKLNNIMGSKKPFTSEDVVAPEFVITQGLRFTFDVRHPLRGLRGGLLELLAMARGNAAILPGLGKTSQDLRMEMLALILPANTSFQVTTTREVEHRCGHAHDKAKDVLATAALLTDVYFLYTPAQIWLAALLTVDEPLTLFYLDTKFPVASNADAGDVSADLAKVKIITLIRTCASILSSHQQGAGSTISREELIRIDKKLYQCQNPEKRDLVALNEAVKRNGGEAGDEDADSKAAKKRKKEREARERDGDVFGGELGK